jgi:hypothetical protein
LNLPGNAGLVKTRAHHNRLYRGRERDHPIYYGEHFIIYILRTAEPA